MARSYRLIIAHMFCLDEDGWQAARLVDYGRVRYADEVADHIYVALKEL